MRPASVILKHPEYLYSLLLICLPLSTEIQVTNSLGTDLPDEFLMLAVTGLFFLMVLYKPGLIKNGLSGHPIVMLLLAHLAWIGIAVFFSEQPLLSFKYLLAKIWYIIPFVYCTLLICKRQWLVKLALCLIIPMLFVVIIALIIHTGYGFSFADVSKTVSPFFRNHVNYAAMLACIIPMVIALLQHSSGKSKHFLRATLIIFILGIALSYSRGAWLALVMGGVVVYAIRKKMMEWLFLISTLVIVGGFCFLGYNNKYIDYRPDFNKTIFHTDFAQHMTATYRFRDLSTAERFYRWIAAIRLSDDHQLTGVGPNNFYNSYKPYAVSAYKTWVSNNKDHSTVHNYFLLLLCEQGIPGLLIFIALLFAGFYYAQKIYHNATDPVFKTTAITLGAILGIITTVNFLSDLIETDKIGSLFFIGLGMLVWMDCRVKKTVIHHPEGVAAS